MAAEECELTDAEWEIIRVVWEHEPCAAPAVQEALVTRKKWTYSTVKTLMDRMAAKGLLTTERIRNLILYRSTVSRRDAQRGELMRTVRRAFGGAFTPMMQFMLDGSTLSRHELEEVEDMIRRRGRPRRSAGPRCNTAKLTRERC